eukprot:4688587-Amphidinium_carterae.1
MDKSDKAPLTLLAWRAKSMIVGKANLTSKPSATFLQGDKSEYLSVPASPSAVSGPTSKVRQFQVPMRNASESRAFSSGTSGGSLRFWNRKRLTLELNDCCHSSALGGRLLVAFDIAPHPLPHKASGVH